MAGTWQRHASRRAARTSFFALLAAFCIGWTYARADFPVADQVVVRKAERKLYLMRGEEVLGSYAVALGRNPHGPKEKEGDFRTPEGTYRLDWRNAYSAFYLAIHVSYPNGDDLRRARSSGVDPGGMIMIHGLPNDLKHNSVDYLRNDWTDGCIAVSNSAMIDIWLSVQDDTPITILP
jgi:murein L,D-transpeptidase YafK